ncbi:MULTISPECIES: hypothetical protein [Streptosporangium]|uniref:Uncharacterized protein n=1 Tax=Streptosporangium brasiliense TaxID=47480 RepID=A0ABT9RM75_9ACTN|nr:hypothetical protein [Streptosporangium brasiliense]MDP9870403.1 hypothetical protein [Streptosporangium brasiliense]
MNGSGAAALGQPPAAPAGDEPTPEKTPGLPVRVAFVLFQDYDGQWVAHNDISLISDKLSIDKIAHPDEMDAGCAAVRSDIQAQKTAIEVERRMREAARLVQEQAANAAIMNRIKPHA